MGGFRVLIRLLIMLLRRRGVLFSLVMIAVIMIMGGLQVVMRSCLAALRHFRDARLTRVSFFPP
jgi:hypothetical protein